MYLSDFKGPIVSYFSAALSYEQRLFFLVTFFIVIAYTSPNPTRAWRETNPIHRNG